MIALKKTILFLICCWHIFVNAQVNIDTLKSRKTIFEYHSIKDVKTISSHKDSSCIIIAHSWFRLSSSNEGQSKKRDVIWITQINSKGDTVFTRAIESIQQFNSIKSFELEGDVVYLLLRNNYSIGDQNFDGGVFIHYNIKTKQEFIQQLMEEPLAIFRKDKNSFYVMSIERGHHCNPPEYKTYLNTVDNSGKLLNKKEWGYTLCGEDRPSIEYYDKKKKLIYIKNNLFFKGGQESNLCPLASKTFFFEKTVNPYLGRKPVVEIYTLPEMKKKKTLYLVCDITPESFKFLDDSVYTYTKVIPLNRDKQLNGGMNSSKKKVSDSTCLVIGNVYKKKDRHLNIDESGEYFRVSASELFVFTGENRNLLDPVKKDQKINIKRIKNGKIIYENNFYHTKGDGVKFFPVVFNDFTRYFYTRYKKDSRNDELGFFDVAD